jgi:hypothetical protein
MSEQEPGARAANTFHFINQYHEREPVVSFMQMLSSMTAWTPGGDPHQTSPCLRTASAGPIRLSDSRRTEWQAAARRLGVTATRKRPTCFLTPRPSSASSAEQDG